MQYHVHVGSLKESCSTFPQKVATGYQLMKLLNSLSISQKTLFFLQDVEASLPDAVKVNELSSMTTYSVPKITRVHAADVQSHLKTLYLTFHDV